MNKQEISKLQIDLSKVNAIGQKYFNLFDKHIPVNISGNILIYDISNADCIINIIRKNPNAKYFIYGNSFVNEAIKCINETWDIEFLDETFDLYNIDMKFDCIVMNPPYSRNLHLKILAEAIKHLKDDNSVCVNLSPVRWLQDPLAKYKKNSDLKRFEESVAKHIEKLEIYDSSYCTNLFNAVITIDEGIYVCNNSTNNQYDYCKWHNSILNKIIPQIRGLPISIYKNHKCDTFVPIVLIDGGHRERNNTKGSSLNLCRNPVHYGNYFINGISTNGKTLEQCKADNKHCTNGNIDMWPIIVFNNEICAKNFVYETQTLFFKFIYMKSMVDVHVHPEFLPWMGDAINPRTGLKGYESEWTDEDFYKYFDITEEEQKIIEDTMAKYK